MTAVEVRNGYKYYGRSSNPNKKIILNYLNMTVMRGSMYVILFLFYFILLNNCNNNNNNENYAYYLDMVY